MWVCVVYVHACAIVCAYMCDWVYVCKCVCVGGVHVHACMCASMHAFVHACIHVYVCMCMCVCVCMCDSPNSVGQQRARWQRGWDHTEGWCSSVSSLVGSGKTWSLKKTSLKYKTGQGNSPQCNWCQVTHCQSQKYEFFFCLWLLVPLTEDSSGNWSLDIPSNIYMVQIQTKVPSPYHITNFVLCDTVTILAQNIHIHAHEIFSQKSCSMKSMNPFGQQVLLPSSLKL